MKKRRASEAVKEDLAAAEKRCDELRSLIKQNEELLADQKAELEKLVGSSYMRGSGRIHRLKYELENILQAEADENAIPVVWAEPKYGWKGSVFDGVIDRITAKTIFVRKRGAVNQFERFQLDGTHSYHTSINIRKTFGIDADSVPPNFKPAVKPKAAEQVDSSSSDRELLDLPIKERQTREADRIASLLTGEALRNFNSFGRRGLLHTMEVCGIAKLPDAKPDFDRCAGDAICEVCGKEYRRHPCDWTKLGVGDAPFLNLLCDGTLVKL